VADCQTAYRELSTTVFGKPSSGEFQYEVAALESDIKSVASKATDSKSTQLFNETEDRYHTFVVAKRDLVHESASILFRSYKFQGTEIACSILQAVHATSTAPTFFLPVTIDRISYVDRGIGFNNPAQEVLCEARRIWPDR
jgi:predicted patatin/cPLA2 family phospholipase